MPAKCCLTILLKEYWEQSHKLSAVFEYTVLLKPRSLYAKQIVLNYKSEWEVFGIENKLLANSLPINSTLGTHLYLLQFAVWISKWCDAPMLTDYNIWRQSWSKVHSNCCTIRAVWVTGLKRLCQRTVDRLKNSEAKEICFPLNRGTNLAF